jgi:phosphate starvation-inducible PhoH-like protein
MSANHEVLLELQPHNNDALQALCGPLNANLQYMSDNLSVSIVNRAFSFRIKGQSSATKKAQILLLNLYKRLIHKKDIQLDRQEIHFEMCKVDDNYGIEALQPSNTLKIAVPRNDNQHKYLNTIDHNVVTFGVGPAGTGKTFVAVMSALHYLRKGEVDRLILSRPAVDAGEKLGFLPGDMAQKVDPYLRPLYDALYDQIGSEQTNEWIDRGRIEIAPLAFIRGRTFNRSFIILDEGQNATRAQIRMLLTRIGFGSKMVMTGDLSQTDLSEQHSGLADAIHVLGEVNNIGFFEFELKDVVRHPVVRDIISAYENYKK